MLELVGVCGTILGNGLVIVGVLSWTQEYARPSYDEAAALELTLLPCSTSHHARRRMTEMVAAVVCSFGMVADSALFQE